MATPKMCLITSVRVTLSHPNRHIEQSLHTTGRSEPDARKIARAMSLERCLPPLHATVASNPRRSRYSTRRATRVNARVFAIPDSHSRQRARTGWDRVGSWQLRHLWPACLREASSHDRCLISASLFQQGRRVPYCSRGAGPVAAGQVGEASASARCHERGKGPRRPACCG